MYIWVAYFVLEMMEMPFFAAFMIFIILWYEGDGEAFIYPLSLYGCLLELVLALSADDGSSLWKRNGYVITSKHHILRWRGRRRRRRETCAGNFYRDECLFTPNVFSSPSIEDVSHPPCLIVSVTVRATGALANMAVVFLASSWGGGALNSYLRPPYPSMWETWCSSQK